MGGRKIGNVKGVEPETDKGKVMAKGAIRVEVNADTRKAAQQIKGLQKEVSGKVGGALQNVAQQAIGNSPLGSALTQITKLTGGGGLGLGLAGLGPAALGAGALKGLDDLAEQGREAAGVMEKLSTTLTTIDRNFGGQGDGVRDIAHELQLLSANGVNDVNSLAEAQKILTVALQGNQHQAVDMVKSFDDLAAGTGIQVQEWARMTAKVMESGVEYRELNRLAKQGLPIFQALGDAMGTTAEEAKAAAKDGAVSVEDWNKAISNLANNYKGLSSQLSSNTLAGAQATYDASRALEREPAAEAANARMIEHLNQLSEAIQADMEDPTRQSLIKAAGDLQGTIEVWEHTAKQALADLPQTLALSGIRLAEKVVGFDRASAVAKGMGDFPHLANNDASIDLFRMDKTGNQIEGILTELQGQAKQVRTALEKELTEEQRKEFTAAQERIDTAIAAVSEALKRTRAEEATTAQAAANAAEQTERREEIAKIYDKNREADVTLAQRVAEATGGAPAETAQGVLDAINSAMRATEEKAFKEQEISAEEMNQYRQLSSMRKQAVKDAEAEAKADKALAESREKAAKAAEEAAFNAKLAEDRQQISLKAAALKDVDVAQQDYNKITQELKNLQEDRALQLEEEAWGIYREKWRGLDVASYDRQEARLLKAQEAAAQKLDQQKKALETFDQRWNDARTNLNRFFSGAFTGNAVRVRGTAEAG